MLRQLILLIVLSAIAFVAVGQSLNSRWVMGISSFSNTSVVDDSTYTTTIGFSSDQTGNGYLANQIQIGYRILTSTKRQYKIAGIATAGISSATVDIVELPGTTAAPSGTGVAYQYDGTNQQIPLVPVNSTGISAALAAVIQNHNLANGSVSDLDVQPRDTSVRLVYLPGHGYDLENYTAGVLAVREGYQPANATDEDSTQIGYVISVPHPDSIQFVISGEITRTGHGLTVGQVYYLQDTIGGFGTNPGTVASAALFVVDENTLELLEQGSKATFNIPRVPIPSAFLTSFGGDPKNPTDTAMQQVLSLFAEYGRIKPGNLAVLQYDGATDNPNHRGNRNDPSTPAHVFYWDGYRSTRVSYPTVSYDLEATESGALGQIELVPVENVPPSVADVEAWIDTNSLNVFLPNGTILYVVGDGSVADPDYIFQVSQNLTGAGIVLALKDPASGDGGGTLDAFGSPNTLWVSQGRGDNSSAEKGNPTKPYQDPWTARDAASAGDLIYIQDGRFDIDTVDAGNGSYVFTSGIEKDASLVKNGLTYYAEPGVAFNVKYTGGSFSQCLFYSGTNDTDTTAFFGHANIYAPINTHLFFVDNPYIHLQIELDTIIVGTRATWGTTTWYGDAALFDLKAKYIKATRTRFTFGGLGNDTLHSVYNLTAGEFWAERTDENFKLRGGNTKTYNFKIGKLTADYQYYFIDSGDGPSNDYHLNFEVGEMIARKDPINPPGGSGLACVRLLNNSGYWKNSTFRYHVDRYYSPDGIQFFNGPTRGNADNENSYIVVSGNFRGVNGPALSQQSQSSKNTTLPFIIQDATIWSDSSSAFTFHQGGNVVIQNSYLQGNANVSPVLMLTNTTETSLELTNCYIKAPANIPAIGSTVAGSRVSWNNSASNSRVLHDSVSLQTNTLLGVVSEFSDTITTTAAIFPRHASELPVNGIDGNGAVTLTLNPSGLTVGSWLYLKLFECDTDAINIASTSGSFYFESPTSTPSLSFSTGAYRKLFLRWDGVNWIADEQ